LSRSGSEAGCQPSAASVETSSDSDPLGSSTGASGVTGRGPAGVSGLWQRKNRPGATGTGEPAPSSATRSGGTSKHAPIAELHLGAQAQPYSQERLSITGPGRGWGREPRSESSRGIEARSPPV